jgi:hypothetical protein
MRYPGSGGFDREKRLGSWGKEQSTAVIVIGQWMENVLSVGPPPLFEDRRKKSDDVLSSF